MVGHKLPKRIVRLVVVEHRISSLYLEFGGLDLLLNCRTSLKSS